MNTTDYAAREAAAAKRAADDRAKAADDKARQAIEDAKHPDSVHPAAVDAPAQATVHGGSMPASVRGGIGSTAAERAEDMRVRGAQRGGSEAELNEAAGDEPAADKPKPAGADPIVLALGDFATVSLGFPDDHDKELGDMRAPGMGSVSSSDDNIVTASVIAHRVDDRALDSARGLRLIGHNLGKADVTYRLDDTELMIPVEIVRRTPKAIVVADVTRERIAPVTA